MIPKDFITEWRKYAPWVSDAQVEQDLIISRAIIEIFRDDYLKGELAFRGGTALSKLFLGAHRYSEDIDLVQVKASPIGPILNSLRKILDPILGKPSRNNKEGNVNIVYKFMSEDAPGIPLRLKVEINTREHFNVLGFIKKSYSIQSRWYSGSAEINTYSLEELLATKLRALYQRRKGRDLYDLWLALSSNPELNKENIVKIFKKYLIQNGQQIKRKDFIDNLKQKISNKDFITDIFPLIIDKKDYNIEKAQQLILAELVELI